MAVVNSSTFNFEEVVQRMLRDYGYEVMDEVYEALSEVSKEAVKKLKAESRQKFKANKKTGKNEYAAGWTRTIEKKRLNVYATVHGKKPTYALAHLLEKGHALRQGGRTNAVAHIQPVNDWAQDEAMDRIVQKLEARL